MPAPPRCLICDESLKEGFLADHNGATIMVARWCPGIPEPHWFLGGETKGSHVRKEGIKMSAWRCSTCGRIELFAHEPPTTA